MRWRPLTWLLLSLLLFAGAAFFWRLGDEWEARRAEQSKVGGSRPKVLAPSRHSRSKIRSQDSAAAAKGLQAQAGGSRAGAKSYRLSNTSRTARALERSDTAILLANALLDTTQPVALAIPGNLRAQGDPGSYIVQARAALDNGFRALLDAAGASIVSYIPNNAYLVRANAAVAQNLAAQPQVQAVLPYEPYYKLKSSLLPLAVEQEPLPQEASLNLLLFADARDDALAQLKQLGARVADEEISPFGPVVRVVPPADSLAALAGLPGVQEIELVHQRVPANDLSRFRLGVSPDLVSPASTNYLGLSGSNILVNVNDTGVDATHPDLTGRVEFDFPLSGVDTNGHGTHVAGIIASSGGQSSTVTNASGPAGLYFGTNTQFRGMAPGATIFSLLADPLFGPSYSDSYLQETAAQTNAFISNNSWNYSDLAQYKPDTATYDLAAASYDAAVRDALPQTSGPQPMLFVFAAGDSGAGHDDGTGGQANTILSPATAKNVITVGAIEQPRSITNQVAYDIADGLTNAIWATATDSSNQVASFSSRGNAGAVTATEFGRFKPDVVAPGTFVISTRSGQWDTNAYYTEHEYSHFPELFLDSNQFYSNSFPVPPNAVRVDIRLVNRRSPSLVAPVSPAPFPDLPIFVAGYPIGSNILSMVPAPINPCVFSVGNASTQLVAFDVVADVMTTDPNDLTLPGLQNLNDSLGGGLYRYESGTSMAAAGVSGVLALMQEFLEAHGRTNGIGGAQGRSPALMKAMLINGARSMNGYNLQVNNVENFQGWGVVQLPSTLHGGLADESAPTNSMWLLDQDPLNALATGQSHMFQVSVRRAVRNQPLRITLAWTDPPGNPVASKPLVNDLDLVVTNLDTVGTDNVEVYFGNDIAGGNDFNMPWDTNTVANIDSANNVENVFIPAPLGTNYSITVSGHRVNVNAVTLNPDNIVQDYALVVSCGDGAITNAIAFSRTGASSANELFLTGLTNAFIGSSNYFGQTLQNQRVGANPALLGTNVTTFSDFNSSPAYPNPVMTIGVTNQWNFYVIENTSGFTNVAFSIFDARELSVPRMGVDVLIDTNATRTEADIDMYVSRDTNLFLLDPVVLSNAYKLIGRGGTDSLVLSNAQPGFYYIAVKSEDQMAAEFSLQVLFSLFPLAVDTGNGVALSWLDSLPIPDGSPQSPGVASIGPLPIGRSLLVRRVIVTNNFGSQLVGDLAGALVSSEIGTPAVLINHAPLAGYTNPPPGWIYDDSDEGDIPGAIHSAGPGDLEQFAGSTLSGSFSFYMEDNQLGHVGFEGPLFVFLERQPPLTGGITNTILPGHCTEDFIVVSNQVVSMTVTAGIISGTGPVSLQICQVPDGPCTTNYDVGSDTSVTLNQFSTPPLTPGTWRMRLCNLGTDVVKVFLKVTLEYQFNRTQTQSFTTTPLLSIPDDAVSYTTITITNHMTINSLSVGLLLTNPFPDVSDLAITLISPDGQRILLFEDRGGDVASAIGSTNFTSDLFGSFYTNMTPFYTNDFEDVPTGPYAPGTIFGGWTVLSNMALVFPELPAPWLSNNVLMPEYAAVSNSLPTTNSTSYHLSFDVTHAPYLVGTVGWWPLDGNANDLFGGHNGLLCGDVAFSAGVVGQAFYGDGVGCEITVPACPDLDVAQGREVVYGAAQGFTIEGWINPADVTNAAPLVEWNDPTNLFPLGVQFWLAQRFSLTNGPGSLTAVLWDTNLQPHVISTPDLVVTNAGWQHVALTYDATTRQARIYTNGWLAAGPQVLSTTNFVPRTSANLYFGFHPAGPLAGASFEGGLDEIGLYDRALTDCEIAAIFSAGSAGKYGTNILFCPLTNTPAGSSLTAQLITTTGTSSFTFTNGLLWTNGPQWETDSIDFANLLLYAGTNGPATNVTGIVLSGFDPNTVVDNFVLSALTTNEYNGMVNFTEAGSLPIKFAPVPYLVSNIPVVLVFSNDFEGAPEGVYPAGTNILSLSSDPAFGPALWTVTNGSVTVITNTMLDANGTNCVALATGGLQCSLPTIAGHKYQLTYSLRGPGAVSWWNGAVEPLSQRAWDLIGGNNGAFVNGATNTTTPAPLAIDDTAPAAVGGEGLYFDGLISDGMPTNPVIATKIDLGDPPNLRLTNSFTIEGWIKPITQTNTFYIGLDPEDDRAFEQILFRGDERDCRDPYYLGFEYDPAGALEILFHVEGPNSPTCGYTMETPNAVPLDQWTHVAAVFEYNYPWTNNAPWPTNRLRIYLDGQVVTNYTSATQPEPPVDGLTGEAPFADLDPAYNPGVAIGARSRYDSTQSYRGYMDELSVYGRALTDPEIEAIYDSGAVGKADLTVAPALSLAQLSVVVDGVELDRAYGDNARWNTRTVTFTALHTNSVLLLQSLLPGTMVDGISLAEVPSELDYQPETSLAALNGLDAYGTWQLEIWDTRAGPGAGQATNLPVLVSWQLNFQLVPAPTPPVVQLAHGLPYTNSLVADGVQYFIVNVPQWAVWATNVLQFAAQYGTTNPLNVGVWFNTNQFPAFTTNDILLLAGTSGTTNLTTNTVAAPWIVPGQACYLAVSNPNPVSVTFAIGVWFDITTLTNCEALTNVVGPAGIPRYFQFDVPTNALAPALQPQQVIFYLTGVESNYVGFSSNVTVVLSEHLPLPDLTHYDYISSSPRTNDDVVMVLTNTTPWAIQTNRWYAGVFNSAATNVPFTVQACYATNYPVLIPLTNGVPYVAAMTDPYVALPGPPQAFFFQFQITNFVDGVLFELYGLSGDADLVLERDVPPTMPPYWAESFRTGLTPEQIVLRTGPDLADLEGTWYLGVYNNDTTNVAYTIRAVVPTNGLLVSAQPIVMTASVRPASPGHLLLQWNAVEGEKYVIYFTDSLQPPIIWTALDGLIATTPCPTYEVPILPTGNRFYQIAQVAYLPQFSPTLYIQLWTNNLVRLSWSTNFTGFTLQYATTFPPVQWFNLNLPVTIEANRFVVYDVIGPTSKYYRLIP